jgi:thioredoxin-related protein
VIAPTQRYGFVGSGETATRDQEDRHILQVRDMYYGFLRNEPVPVHEANHLRYGVSSTPTLVLLDREGIVRLYHPGSMAKDELEAVIEKLL